MGGRRNRAIQRQAQAQADREKAPVRFVPDVSFYR